MRDVYTELQSGAFRDNRYLVHAGPAWLQITAQDCDIQAIEDAGWKFRLSITADDIPKAWNIVADELMRDRMPHAAKVATPSLAEKMKDQNYPQAGKSITIYTSDKDTPQNYMSLLSRIEDRLRAAGVRGVAKARGDFPVPNSLYMSYRNDRLAHGGYNDARNNDDMATRFSFHGGRANPYAGFAVKESPYMPARNSKLTVSDAIKRELGKENVLDCGFGKDGSIEIAVPSTFSRTNLERLGISDAASLRRRAGPVFNIAVIDIPADRVPAHLKIAPDTITPPPARGFLSRLIGR